MGILVPLLISAARLLSAVTRGVAMTFACPFCSPSEMRALNCAVPNTPANLRLWIRNPAALKPGCKMPAMDLGDQQIKSVAAYLETLR